jgi:hypothetical protein
MIIRHKDSSAVSHWSRDFVEHLRSVHFALTTLSVALVIVLLSTGDAQLDKAFTQAAQIEALLHRWKDVQARAYESATQAARLPIGGTVNVSASLFVFEWDPTTHMFVPGKRLVGASLQVAQQQFTDYEEWKFPGSKMLEPPSTLGEFRSWWNELNRGISVLVPNFASDLKSCDAKISNRPRDVVKCSRTASQYTATSRSFRWVIPKSSDQEISLAWDVGPPSTGGAGDPHIVELLTAHELRTVRLVSSSLESFILTGAKELTKWRSKNSAMFRVSCKN